MLFTGNVAVGPGSLKKRIPLTRNPLSAAVLSTASVWSPSKPRTQSMPVAAIGAAQESIPTLEECDGATPQGLSVSRRPPEPPSVGTAPPSVADVPALPPLVFFPPPAL